MATGRRMISPRFMGAETMPEYTVVPDGLHGYGVEVRDINCFRSVRGFQTKSAALAWFVEQQAHDADEVGKQASEQRPAQQN
jgi:hypothetical protein